MLVFNKSRFPLTIEGVTIPALESKEIKITASNQDLIDRLVNQNQITLLGGVDLRNKGTSQSESTSTYKVLKFPEAPKKRRKRSKRKNLNS